MAFVARDGKPPRGPGNGQYVMFMEKPVWDAGRCMWRCADKLGSGPASWPESEWRAISKVRLAPGEGPVEASIVAVDQA